MNKAHGLFNRTFDRTIVERLEMKELSGSYGTISDFSITDFDDDTLVMVRAEVVKYSIDKLMFILGQKGMGVHVRYDPFREKDNFTVIVGNDRIGDTDNPRELLMDLLIKQGIM